MERMTRFQFTKSLSLSLLLLLFLLQVALLKKNVSQHTHKDLSIWLLDFSIFCSFLLFCLSLCVVRQGIGLHTHVLPAAQHSLSFNFLRNPLLLSLNPTPPHPPLSPCFCPFTPASSVTPEEGYVFLFTLTESEEKKMSHQRERKKDLLWCPSSPRQVLSPRLAAVVWKSSESVF